MESTLKLVGLKAAGGMRHALLPSFTSEQFQNYILRSNADDFGEVKKTEESEEKIEDSDGGEKEEEKGTEEDLPQVLYRMEKCKFGGTSAKSHSIDLLVTDIPYNVCKFQLTTL